MSGTSDRTGLQSSGGRPPMMPTYAARALRTDRLEIYRAHMEEPWAKKVLVDTAQYEGELVEKKHNLNEQRKRLLGDLESQLKFHERIKNEEKAKANELWQDQLKRIEYEKKLTQQEALKKKEKLQEERLLIEDQFRLVSARKRAEMEMEIAEDRERLEALVREKQENAEADRRRKQELRRLALQTRQENDSMKRLKELERRAEAENDRALQQQYSEMIEREMARREEELRRREIRASGDPAAVRRIVEEQSASRERELGLVAKYAKERDEALKMKEETSLQAKKEASRAVAQFLQSQIDGRSQRRQAEREAARQERMRIEQEAKEFQQAQAEQRATRRQQQMQNSKDLEVQIRLNRSRPVSAIAAGSLLF
jgi:hypothetical protein